MHEFFDAQSEVAHVLGDEGVVVAVDVDLLGHPDLVDCLVHRRHTDTLRETTELAPLLHAR